MERKDKISDWTQSSINQRIAYISEHFFGGNTTQMAKAVFVKQSTLRDIVGDVGNAPSFETMRQIVGNTTLNISPDWLLTGKGEMQKTIEVNSIFNGKAIEALKENQNVPLYNIEAAANLSTIFTQDTENIDGYISLPKAPSVDGAIPIRGDSMYPLLKSGDYVVYKKVSSPEYLIFGQMYIVEYEWDGDTLLVVKYVQRSEREGFVRLVSYNTHHEPMDVPVHSIRNLALVKISVRYNTLR